MGVASIVGSIVLGMPSPVGEGSDIIPDPYYEAQKKPKVGSKPKRNVPTGTIPMDEYGGLSREEKHKIKKGVNAGPKDWTGIAPNGDVITGDSEGNGINNGPADGYLSKNKCQQ